MIAAVFIKYPFRISKLNLLYYKCIINHETKKVKLHKKQKMDNKYLVRENKKM